MSCMRLLGLARSVPRNPSSLHAQVRSFTGNRLVDATTDSSVEDERVNSQGVRQLQTLAIETSCDDTSVAVLAVSTNVKTQLFRTEVLFHEKITAKSDEYNGIHPLVALLSHQRELGPLVQKAVKTLRPRGYGSHGALPGPDFISVTRGPGMRSNLSVGLDTAKGLATAWNIPLIGTHHMQAHALTPRLCSTLYSATSRGRILHGLDGRADGDEETIEWSPRHLEPQFPFLTVLVSGGHTMLIDSQSLTEHKVLAQSSDIALGDCLDKAARTILTGSERLVPYGKALEDFAFPDGQYEYNAPKTRGEELQRRQTRWGWSLPPPLAESKAAHKSSRRMMFSFGGLGTAVERTMTRNVSEEDSLPNIPRPAEDISLEERRELAREVQRVAFEHVVSRIILHLQSLPEERSARIKTTVLSGGVAANKFLRHVIRCVLDARGFEHIELSCPPGALCTDNALMIAWAGMEMYDAGYESELTIRPLRKWSMDPTATDGGILGVGGWKGEDHVESEALDRIASV